MGRAYDIRYYSRDVRRNRDPTMNIAIEESYDAVGKALSVDKHVPGASLAAGGEKSIEERLYPNHKP